MIALALACGPELIIGDEPTTALDVMMQAQILELLEKLREDLGLAMILITHDLSVLAETCDRVAVMYGGQIAEIGGGRTGCIAIPSTRTPAGSWGRSPPWVARVSWLRRSRASHPIPPICHQDAGSSRGVT